MKDHLELFNALIAGKNVTNTDLTHEFKRISIQEGFVKDQLGFQVNLFIPEVWEVKIMKDQHKKDFETWYLLEFGDKDSLKTGLTQLFKRLSNQTYANSNIQAMYYAYLGGRGIKLCDT